MWAARAARSCDGQAPTFTVLGGSDKSWFKNKAHAPAAAIVMDADEIKHMLPEHQGWNAAKMHEASGDLFDAITGMARGLGLDTMHDATMKTGHKAVQLVQGFKDSGYRTEAH